MRLTDFKVLSFDCYGTLIDWESGMIAALRPLTKKVTPTPTRNTILEAHAKVESMQQQFTPTMGYRDILATVYKRLADMWRVSVTWEECQAYGRSVGDWPAFADSAASLAYLRRHFKLVVLSNVDNQSFGLSNRRLGVNFDAVYVSEDIGAYKPALVNFEYMLDNLAHLGIEKHQILHVAESMFHDHGPANTIGLKSAWIFRRHADEGFGATKVPCAMPHFDLHFDSLAEFVAAHRAEFVDYGVSAAS